MLSQSSTISVDNVCQMTLLLDRCLCRAICTVSELYSFLQLAFKRGSHDTAVGFDPGPCPRLGAAIRSCALGTILLIAGQQG